MSFIAFGALFASISAVLVRYSATVPRDWKEVVSQHYYHQYNAWLRGNHNQGRRGSAAPINPAGSASSYYGSMGTPTAMAAEGGDATGGNVPTASYQQYQQEVASSLSLGPRDVGGSGMTIWPGASYLTASKRQVKKIYFHAAGSGIPEIKTILGGFVIRGFLGIKTLWVKSIGLVFSVASGLMIGKQGPLLHIACCVGNVLSRMFYKYSKNEGKRREILSAASAAGVSVAFGAPVGGVLFSLEEVSYYFPLKTMWRSFFCALIAAVTLKLINPLGSGKLVLFQVTYDRDWQLFELIPFAILGVFGGLYGPFFIKVSSAWNRLRQRTWMKDNPVKEVVLVAVVNGILNYLNPFSRITNGELVANLFGECADEGDLDGLCRKSDYHQIMMLLGVCLLIKVFLMIITFGIKVPAGIFIPSMAIGAIVGRMMGMGVLLVQEMFPDHPIFESCTPGKECVIPGVYAMVGAAAGLAGVTRMTVSLVAIMFELTGALTYVLPIMISIMISKWIGDAISKDSIYDRLIDANGFPYLDHKREYVHMKATTEVMDEGGETLDVRGKYGVRELEGKLARLARLHFSDDGGFPILDGDVLVGYIASNELDHALRLVTARGTDSQPCYFRRTASNRLSGSGPDILVGSPDADSQPHHNGKHTLRQPRTWGDVSSSSGGSSETQHLLGGNASPGNSLRQHGQSRQRPRIWNEDDGDEDWEGGAGDGDEVEGRTQRGDGSPTRRRRDRKDGNRKVKHRVSAGSVASLASVASTAGLSSPKSEVNPLKDANDLTQWVDWAPLMISQNSSMETVMELFVKLGIKTMLVVNEGKYVGTIHKKKLLAYLKECAAAKKL
ncbi:hypothetical protein HK102_001370 [Quaeritorhiza haematococci]|nr:hypothetical protein HK102_001370 [Quaeritorhiza haematococci]